MMPKKEYCIFTGKLKDAAAMYYPLKTAIAEGCCIVYHYPERLNEDVWRTLTNVEILTYIYGKKVKVLVYTSDEDRWIPMQ